MFRPFVLDDTGRPFVELVAPDSAAAIIAGQAYVTNGTADAVYLTTDAVAAADGFVGGFRYTTAGALRAYDATAGLPAGTSTNQGIAMTSDGQVCYSTAASGTYFNIAGVAVDSSGRILIDLLTFELLFADLGAGVVSTVEAINGTTPTFTRATVAWTKLSTGLWAEVASGSPRSFYGANGNTVAGSYLGYFAEGAGTQLVTPDASIRDMTDASWVKGATLTVAKTGIGIDGVTNSCSRLTGGLVTITNTIFQTLTAAASTRTYSCWIKRITGTGLIYITQDGISAVFTEVSGLLNTSTFTRVSITASQLNAVFGIRVDGNGDEILVDFNQFEAGAFATSPLATAGAARNADVLTYPTTGWLDAGGGTLFVEATSPNISGYSGGVLGINDGTTNERILIYRETTDVWQAFAADGGSTVVNASFGSWAAATSSKAALAYALNDFAFVRDGGTVGTDNTASVPTVTQLEVGTSLGDNQPYGPIRRMAYYAVRLPDATLQELTA